MKTLIKIKQDIKPVKLYDHIKSIKPILMSEIASPNPKVACLIISYNQVNYIEQAILSVINQVGNFKPYILISDDCSTDGTAGIVEKYANLYPELIKNISPKEHLGLGLNYKHFRDYITPDTDYIAFLEGDDQWLANKLEITVSELVRTRAALCATEYIDYNTISGTFSGIRNRWCMRDIISDNISSFDLYMAARLSNISNIVMYKSIFISLPDYMFEPIFSEILLAPYLLVNNYKIKVLSNVLVLRNILSTGTYCGLPTSESRIKWEQVLAEVIVNNIFNTNTEFSNLARDYELKRISNLH